MDPTSMSDTSSESKHSRGSRRRSSRHSTSSVVKFDDVDTKRDPHPVFSFPDGNVTFLVRLDILCLCWRRRSNLVFDDALGRGDDVHRLPVLPPKRFARLSRHVCAGSPFGRRSRLGFDGGEQGKPGEVTRLESQRLRSLSLYPVSTVRNIQPPKIF